MGLLRRQVREGGSGSGERSSDAARYYMVIVISCMSCCALLYHNESRLHACLLVGNGHTPIINQHSYAFERTRHAKPRPRVVA